MYKVDVDKDRKFIRIEISGFFKIEEAEALKAELENNHFKQFKPKEPKILFSVVDFKPVSTKIGPAIENLKTQAVSYGSKVASVNNSDMSKQQVDRLVEVLKDGEVARFNNEDTAMKYLFG